MRIPSKLLALFIVLIGLSGCHETEYEYWLNPDGSGKVAIHSVFPSMAPMNFQESSPDFQMAESIHLLLTKSKGISVWKNVKYEWRKDGMIVFSGEALFNKIEDVVFNN
ncbi:hypothetical protein K8I31_19925, partial [bacterium]|nr:hypothetical protein [bacterium]